jgi:hypothetical protein
MMGRPGARMRRTHEGRSMTDSIWIRRTYNIKEDEENARCKL